MERRIRQVAGRLQEMYTAERGTAIHVHEESRIVRPFSTAVILRAEQAGQDAARVVMKTINHHPEIEATTRAENQAEVEYRILKELSDVFGSERECGVPRPVAVFPELESYVMEFAEGGLLIDRYRYVRWFTGRQGFSSLVRDYRRMGKWLKIFQQSTTQQMGAESALAPMLERIRDRMRQLDELADPRIPARLRSVIDDEVRKQCDIIGNAEIPVCGRHGDFGPWNIIASDSRLTVIDFMGSKPDFVGVDITKIMMNFEDEARYLLYHPARIASLRSAFLGGYGALPRVPLPAVMICEIMQRLSDLLATLTNPGKRPDIRISRSRCMKANLKWLMSENRVCALWPQQSGTASD